MLNKSDLVLVVLGCALVLRLVAMAIFPLTDTTEARYGEIARLMLETGDWITPHFDYGVPFWGKPPLAFWLEAGAYSIFGVNEFAGRLPSLLAILGSMACLYRFARDVWNRQVGLWALAIFATNAVVYVNAGAILTDPFLTFGTTLSMVSMAMALRHPRSAWRYLFFVGLAVGLLAKGPITLVLVAGPLGIWVILKNQWLAVWRAVPWVRGLCLTMALALPWYVAAELKSSGFVEYFIIGEHWKRFTEAGWQGDLYGSAHRRALGTIWLYWLGASFPWGLLALWRLRPGILSKAGRGTLVAAAMNTQTAYLLSWAVFPMVFFTVAGNILWTYVLPAMPAFAVLLAASMAGEAAGGAAGEPGTRGKSRRLIAAFAWVAPAVLAAFVVFALVDPTIVRTEKYLVRAYDEHRQGTSPLVYIQDRPFSARFYTLGQARVSTVQDLVSDLATGSTETEFVAVPNHLKSEVERYLPAPPDIRFASGKFTLYGLARSAPPNAASGSGQPAPR